jgi:hypothetical protein
MIIPLDVKMTHPKTKEEYTAVIYVSRYMGIRITEDSSAQCWIALADNSVWKSAYDLETTVDYVQELLRQPH